MSRTMMRFGLLRFSIATAAYQEMTRSTAYRWARQERIGTNDALQFTGLGPDQISLRGVIFTSFAGGTGQVDRMRLQAAIGVPLPLISGTGRVLGFWCAEAITEGQSTFVAQGVPLAQTFDLQLTRYDGGLRALLPF